MLKWIALFLMTLDHLAFYLGRFLSGEIYTFMRTLGRLSFPIFAYYVVLGYARSKSLPKYFLRLIGFALVTHVVIIGFSHFQPDLFFVNTLFTLSLGIILIFGYDLCTQSMLELMGQVRPIGQESLWTIKLKLKPIALSPATGLILGGGILCCVAILTTLIQPDYQFYGLLTILLFHQLHIQLGPFNRSECKRQVRIYLIAFALFNLLWLFIRTVLYFEPFTFVLMQCFASFAPVLFPLILQEKRPTFWRQQFFYLYYPLHLAILMGFSFIVPA